MQIDPTTISQYPEVMIGPKIKELKVTPIAITDPPLLNSVGIHAPYALRTVIELITDDNIHGISEIPGNIEIDKLLDQSRAVILGSDPFQLNKLKADLFERFGKDEQDTRGDNPWDDRKLVHVFSALEVACLDIQGKVCNRPIVDLLGGRCRDHVSFGAYLFYKMKGAGGKFGHQIDPDATGWAAARQAAAESAEISCIRRRLCVKNLGLSLLN